MKKIQQEFIEIAQLMQHMRDQSRDNCIEHAFYTYQTWATKKIISALNTIQKIKG